MRDRRKFIVKRIKIVFPILVVVIFLSTPFCVTFGEPKPWFTFFVYCTVFPIYLHTNNAIVDISLMFTNIFLCSIIISIIAFYTPQLYRNLVNRNLNK